MNAIDNPVAADNMPSGVAVYPHVAGWDTEPVSNVANVVSAVADFTTAELVLFARLLCAADGEKASWLIDALIKVQEVEPDAERHERIEAAILAGAGALE